MLQFDKSLTTNTNAVWIETVNTSSGYYDSLAVVYSQSYDLSSGQFDLITVSTPNMFRNWLIISNSGSEVPAPTGQYDAEIYTLTDPREPRWAFTTDVWSTTTEKWATFGEPQLDELIYSDRAWISGSNGQEITQYVSSNEYGKYTTYNG